MAPHALVLGGTGSLWLAATHLARAGWAVTVTGRDPTAVPPVGAELGIVFTAVDRADVAAQEDLLGDGVDLLVDGQGYAPHLARWSRRCGSTAYLSARAVYVDRHGRHLNSPGGAEFDGPVREDTPTMAWHGEPWDTAEGYGAAKAESERRLLAGGERVSVLRPGTIHGPWVRQARTPAVLALARTGPGPPPVVRVVGADVVGSTTSAEVLARAVLACARMPGQRVLNVADADPQPAGELARAVWRAAGVDPLPEVVAVAPEEAPAPGGRLPSGQCPGRAPGPPPPSSSPGGSRWCWTPAPWRTWGRASRRSPRRCGWRWGGWRGTAEGRTRRIRPWRAGWRRCRPGRLLQ